MRFVLLAIQMLLLSVPLWAADPLSGFVEDASLLKLRAGDSLSVSIPSDGTLTLLPPAARGDRIAGNVKEVQPTMGVEMMRIIGGSHGALDTPAGLLEIYNALHAVSTMKGITYYSVTHRKVQVLFTQSYAVTDAERLERISDPLFTEIPAENVLFTFQEDGSFGKNAYQNSFWPRPDHLEVLIENISTISFLLVPIVRPRNLVIHAALFPVGRDLLFYGCAYIHTSLNPGDRHSRDESLRNRLAAIAEWLKSRLSLPPAP
jgi:hypothetical protein